jgi:hypothetical protein
VVPFTVTYKKREQNVLSTPHYEVILALLLLCKVFNLDSRGTKKEGDKEAKMSKYVGDLCK